MTPSDVDEIEARAQAATAGPWEPITKDLGYPDRPRDYTGVFVAEGVLPGANRFALAPLNDYMYKADAAFIASARTDVPLLITALREAWAEREATIHARGVCPKCQQTVDLVRWTSADNARGDTSEDMGGWSLERHPAQGLMSLVREACTGSGRHLTAEWTVPAWRTRG